MIFIECHKIHKVLLSLTGCFFIVQLQAQDLEPCLMSPIPTGGNFEGVVSNIDSSTSRNGFGDPLIRISMVLVGSGPMGVTDFFKQEQKKFNLGAFIRIRPPMGQYDPTKLINLGANRWATKLGFAGSYTFRKKLILEGHVNLWLFTETKEFFNGNRIKQKPLISVQLHVAYLFTQGIWIAFSAGQSGMGETIVNGVKKTIYKIVQGSEQLLRTNLASIMR